MAACLVNLEPHTHIHQACELGVVESTEALHKNPVHALEPHRRRDDAAAQVVVEYIGPAA